MRAYWGSETLHDAFNYGVRYAPRWVLRTLSVLPPASITAVGLPPWVGTMALASGQTLGPRACRLLSEIPVGVSSSRLHGVAILTAAGILRNHREQFLHGSHDAVQPFASSLEQAGRALCGGCQVNWTAHRVMMRSSLATSASNDPMIQLRRSLLCSIPQPAGLLRYLASLQRKGLDYEWVLQWRHTLQWLRPLPDPTANPPTWQRLNALRCGLSFRRALGAPSIFSGL